MVNNFLSSIGSSISSVLLPPKTPTKSELHELSLSVQKATSSLEAAKLLSKNSNQLVEETTKVINQKFPDINPTEITQPPIDSSYLLRIITYSLVSCGTGPIDEYLVTNLKEISKVKKEYLSYYIETLQYIKNNHGLKGQNSEVTNFYIDYIIEALN